MKKEKEKNRKKENRRKKKVRKKKHMIWRRRGRRMDKNPDVADDDEGEDSNGNMTIQSSKAIEGINRAANHQKVKKILKFR